MANLGFFLGGLSDSLNSGFARNQQADFQQQELKLQAQAQDNAQKRFDMARNDKLAEELWNSIQSTVDNARSVGHNEKEIQPAIQGLVDQYRKFTTAIGYPGMADQKMAALWASPPSTDVEAAHARAKETPKVEKLTSAAGDQSIVIVDPRTGRVVNAKGDGASTEPPDFANMEGTALRDALAKRSGLTADQLDVGAAQLNDGNTSVLTNLGRGKQGGEAVKALRAWAAYKLIHEEGLSPQQAAERVNSATAEYKATQAGAVSLGRREANAVGAATTAAQTAPRVLEASRAVDKTQFPSLNAIILAAKQGSGDEKVIRLGIAVNTFVNNYARALGAGNSAVTNAARSEAWELLNKAWSQGQIEAAIDQMLNKELPSEIFGAQQGLKTFLRKGSNAFAPGEKITGMSVQEGGVTKRYKFNQETGELE